MKGRTISLQLESSASHLTSEILRKTTHIQPWKCKETKVEYTWKTSVPSRLKSIATPYKKTRKTLDFLLETQKYIASIRKPIQRFRFNKQKLNLELHTLMNRSELIKSSPVHRKPKPRKNTIILKAKGKSQVVLVPTILSFSTFDSPKSLSRTTVSTPCRKRPVPRPSSSTTCSVTTLSLGGCEDYLVHSYALPQALSRPSPQPTRRNSSLQHQNRRITAFLHRFERPPSIPLVHGCVV